MRRPLFAGAVLGAVLLAPGGALAQTTPPPTTTPPLAATAFALTQPSFPPPGHVVTSQVESNDAATADQRIPNLMQKSFAQENRVTGYFMDVGQANYDAKGAEHPIYTRYLVSIYNSVDDATAAFNDQRDGWNTALTNPSSPINGKVTDLSGQQFGDLQAPGLYQATGSTPQGDADVSDLLFKRGQYVIEVWQAALHQYATPYGASALPYLFSVAKALDGIAAGTPPVTTQPAPADFSILTARFEKNGQQLGLTQPALTTTAAGSTVQMSVYAVVRNAAGSAGAKTDFKLTSGKRSAHQTHTFALGSTLADYYAFTLYDVRLPRSGSYSFTATITIGKAKKHATVKIKVSGGKKKVALVLTGPTVEQRAVPKWTGPLLNTAGHGSR
jgi:hypothetical protein